MHEQQGDMFTLRTGQFVHICGVFPLCPTRLQQLCADCHVRCVLCPCFEHGQFARRWLEVRSSPYTILSNAGEGAEPRGGSVERAYVRYVAPIVDDAAAAGYDLDEADEAWLAARRAKVRQLGIRRGVAEMRPV